jgi:hypothetical protein
MNIKIISSLVEAQSFNSELRKLVSLKLDLPAFVRSHRISHYKLFLGLLAREVYKYHCVLQL